MKIGVSSYSFANAITGGRMVLEDVPKCAADMGFDGVEYGALESFGCANGREALARLGGKAQQAGLPVFAYSTNGNLIEGDMAKETARLIEEAKVARDFGAKLYRFDLSSNATISNPALITLLPRVVEGVRCIADAVSDMDITLMVENHVSPFRESGEVVTLIETVNRSNFAALLDVGNFSVVEEKIERAISAVVKHAKHVHMKDFFIKSGQSADPGEGWFSARGGSYLRGAIVGHGDIPVVSALRALKNAGYTGECSIEFEGMEPCEQALRIGLDNLRRYIAQVRV